MADTKRSPETSIDAIAFDLLADAFLDVTGVLMRIDPKATTDLLRLIEERMVASLDGTTRIRGSSTDHTQASVLAVWKAGTAIKAAETALCEKTVFQ